MYGLVTIDPTIPYRISTGIASTFYRAKADLLATFRNDSITARTVSVAIIDFTAFIVVCRHFAVPVAMSFWLPLWLD